MNGSIVHRSPSAGSSTSRSSIVPPERLDSGAVNGRRYNNELLTATLPEFGSQSIILEQEVAAAAGTTVFPGVGDLQLTGLAPMLPVFAGTGALTLTGVAPTVQIAVVVFPGVGSLVLNGLAPVVLGSAPAAPPAVGGRPRRVVVHRAPSRRTPLFPADHHPRYFTLPEDQVVETGVGTITCRGQRPTVHVTDRVAEQAVIWASLDDPDLELALALEDF